MAMSGRKEPFSLMLGSIIDAWTRRRERNPGYRRAEGQNRPQS